MMLNFTVYNYFDQVLYALRFKFLLKLEVLLHS